MLITIKELLTRDDIKQCKFCANPVPKDCSECNTCGHNEFEDKENQDFSHIINELPEDQVIDV